MKPKYTLRSREVTPPKGYRVDTHVGQFVAWSFSSLMKQTGLSADEADQRCAELLASEGHMSWVYEHVPRLTEQGMGEVVEIPRENFLPALYHYNASLCVYKGKILMAYRRQGHKPGGYSDIGICELDQNLNVIPGSNKLAALPRQYPTETDEHYEDPRLTVISGDLWLTYGSWLGKWKYRPTQHFALLDDDFKVVRDFAPPINGNGEGVTQKNWLLFDHHGQAAFIYEANPHTIFSLDRASGATELFAIREWKTAGWPNGLRGGAPPVLFNGEYWTFVRSHENSDRAAGSGRYQGRRYTVGAYAFCPDTLKVTRCTREPLLRASEQDPGLSWAPLVAFSSGALLHNGQFVVSLGVHDKYTALWHVDMDKLQERTLPV